MTPAQRQTLEKARELLPLASDGPWSARCNKGEWCVLDNEGEIIASITEWSPNLDIVDAALIALAPDLATLADTLARRVEVLEGALRFYGDVSKYPAPLTGGQGELYFDCGQIARAALSATQPKEPRA